MPCFSACAQKQGIGHDPKARLKFERARARLMEPDDPGVRTVFGGNHRSIFHGLGRSGCLFDLIDLFTSMLR